MSEQESVKHTNDLTFANKVLEKITYYTVENVDGILELQGNLTSGIKDFFSNTGDDTRGVSAEVGKKEVALDLDIVGEYGKNIPTAFERAVDDITESVEKMTGLKVVEVNMNVNDILSRTEYEKTKNEEQRKKAQERRQANLNGEYRDGSRVK